MVGVRASKIIVEAAVIPFLAGLTPSFVHVHEKYIISSLYHGQHFHLLSILPSLFLLPFHGLTLSLCFL
jgi:hypothetical protein